MKGIFSNRVQPGAVILLLLAILFGLLGCAWLLAGEGERTAAFMLMQKILAPAGAFFWSNITSLGDLRVLLGIACWVSLGHSGFLRRFLLAACLAGVACKLLKAGFPMPRPLDVLGAEKVLIIGHERSGHSFPSSHAAMIWSFASLLILQGRTQYAWGALVLAFLAACSRIAVGAHWPIDVWVGAGLGMGAAWFSRPLGECWPLLSGSKIELLGWILSGLAILTLPFDAQGYPDGLPIRLLSFCCFFLALLQRFRRFQSIRANGRRIAGQ